MVVLDGNSLTLSQFIRVARNNTKVKLSDAAICNVLEARKKVDDLVDKELVSYGITTGFGKLSDHVIPTDQLSLLQKNLVISHAVGVGESFSEEIIRGIMLLRINALAKGVSGIRLETIDQLILYLNKNIHPVVPEKGSLGASGDLAPLSHVAITLLGLGEVFYEGARMNTDVALERAGIKPLENLGAKDGLSLINGTQALTSVGALTLYDAIQLAKLADVSAALTMEALYGIRNAFDPRVHAVRPHIGQADSAVNVLNIVKGSNMITNQGDVRTQDAYSLRCVPQVHGASKDALNYIIQKVNIEMNSATDNPLIFDDIIISAGNFHGQPMALPFDFMKIAIAELANISERRIERMVNPQLSEGLPAFLVKNPGLNSGFMIMQYSAASLVSENKIIAHPASVDSIPSSANQEDHVSMGTIAARGARDILDNARKVIAIELLANCQAIDLRENVKLGKGSKAAYDVVRKHIDMVEEDIVMYPLINQCEELIKDESILNAVEKAIGKLVI